MKPLSADFGLIWLRSESWKTRIAITESPD